MSDEENQAVASQWRLRHLFVLMAVAGVIFAIARTPIGRVAVIVGALPLVIAAIEFGPLGPRRALWAYLTAVFLLLVGGLVVLTLIPRHP